MSFSFKTAERARKRESGKPLARRDDAKLPFLAARVEPGPELLLDTCVYIDKMQGKAPQRVEDLLAIRTANHSSVAVQELMHTVGVLKPDDPRSRDAVAAIGRAIEAMPTHRLFTADLDVLARGAVYAGILCRTQGYARDARMRALNDCILFLQATKLGLTVLTRNVGDFDLLLQLHRSGHVLFYRT